MTKIINVYKKMKTFSKKHPIFYHISIFSIKIILKLIIKHFFN